jgi:alginate O-acetyltransferase complex protein AlgI
MIHALEWWAFLLLAPVVYWLMPARFRAWGLGVVSLILLAKFAAWALVPMVALSASVFIGFRLRDDAKPAWAGQIMRSTLPVLAVLAYLVVAKYIPAMARLFAGQGSLFDFVVPLGVSYFSFKLLHYVIEMRRSGFADHTAGDYVSWLFLAPIFTAGPIERFDHYLKERTTQEFQLDFVVEGGMRIAFGLVKKFFFGTVVLEVIQRVSGVGIVQLLPVLDTVPFYTIWLLLLLTLLYVYLDFSAYSDIAIGSSRLFGLRIMENFNYPFLATSLQEFWQRWHMTLANWCRSYIYMSMIGLTRNPYYAVVATFGTMGLWHAASPHWIIWGLWHGIGLCVLLYWGRFAMKRKIKIFKTPLGAWAGRIMTIAYVALGGAFTLLHDREPIYQSVRLIAAAFGIHI